MTDGPPTDCRNDQFFDRLNLDEVPLSDTQAHGGEGSIRFARLCHEGQSSGDAISLTWQRFLRGPLSVATATDPTKRSST